MAKEEENKSIFAQIVVAVIVTLIVGGSAPWWWTEFFKKAHSYTNLENYLAKQEWKQADLETSRIFQDFESNASKISCAKIHKVDELWLKYSNRRFGFSVQSYIYRKTGNPEGKYKKDTWRKFADLVGWRVNGNWLESYQSLNLSINAPEGHLPVFAGKKSGMRNINAITRAIKCGI